MLDHCFSLSFFFLHRSFFSFLFLFSSPYLYILFNSNVFFIILLGRMVGLLSIPFSLIYKLFPSYLLNIPTYLVSFIALLSSLAVFKLCRTFISISFIYISICTEYESESLKNYVNFIQNLHLSFSLHTRALPNARRGGWFMLVISYHIITSLPSRVSINI